MLAMIIAWVERQIIAYEVVQTARPTLMLGVRAFGLTLPSPLIV